jgi:hypothetical protein
MVFAKILKTNPNTIPDVVLLLLEVMVVLVNVELNLKPCCKVAGKKGVDIYHMNKLPMVILSI